MGESNSNARPDGFAKWDLKDQILWNRQQGAPPAPPRYPLLSPDQLAALSFRDRRTLELQLQRNPLSSEEVAANLAHTCREGWLK